MLQRWTPDSLFGNRGPDVRDLLELPADISRQAAALREDGVIIVTCYVTSDNVTRRGASTFVPRPGGPMVQS